MNQAIKDYIASLEWQDIESAPRKRGKLCLGRNGDGEVFVMQWGGFQNTETGQVERCWADEPHEFPVYPDEYMPLPDPRTAKVVEMLWEGLVYIYETPGETMREQSLFRAQAKRTLAAVEELLSKENG